MIQAGSKPPWHLDLPGHEELDAALLSRGGDDVPDLAVAPASETDPVPLEDLVPGQQMAHEVRHAPLLHLLDDGAVSALTGDKMASDNLKSDQLLELSLIPFPSPLDQAGWPRSWSPAGQSWRLCGRASWEPSARWGSGRQEWAASCHPPMMLSVYTMFWKNWKHQVINVVPSSLNTFSLPISKPSSLSSFVTIIQKSIMTLKLSLFCKMSLIKALYNMEFSVFLQARVMKIWPWK